MSKKRASSFVDLTGSASEDENPARQRKQARTAANPIPSSQPRASQSLSRDAWGEVDEDEEILDSSQDPEEGHGWVCVGAIDGKIVGIRYYNGWATCGESVMIKREPGNPYDSNAIRINNVQGTQIGHLPKTLAASLAGFMVRVLATSLVENVADTRDRIRDLLYLKASSLERKDRGTALSVLEFTVRVIPMLVRCLRIT